MTDELKQRFERLVAEPPPPSAVPSEAVFERVRKVRRRRAAGAAGLACAAVAAVAIVGTQTGGNSQPPVLGPPSSQTPPRSSAPSTPSASPKPSRTGPAALDVKLTLHQVVRGRTVTMTVTASGTILVPFVGGSYLPTDQGLAGLGQGSKTSYGDGPAVGSFSNLAECAKSTKRYTGRASYPADVHTYARPGTYTYTYTGQFCGLPKNVTATTKVVIR